MKVNVDKAVGRYGDRGAATAIFQDHLGNYLGSSSITFMGVTDVSTLEALPYREALALTLDLNITRVIISSDIATVVKDIEANEGGKHASSIQEIRATGGEFCSVNLYTREGLETSRPIV